MTKFRMKNVNIKKRKKREKKPWSPNRYLVSAARRIWRWDKNRKAVNDESEKKAGKKGFRFCSSCQKRFNYKKVHVDHVIPVGPAPKGFEGWDLYYSKLFTARNNLQSLCVDCHKKKTKTDLKEMK